jgi:hypothetical protein
MEGVSEKGRMWEREREREWAKTNGVNEGTRTVLVESPRWARFNRVYFTIFLANVWKILIFEWILLLKIQINCKIWVWKEKTIEPQPKKKKDLKLKKKEKTRFSLKFQKVAKNIKGG